MAVYDPLRSFRNKLNKFSQLLAENYYELRFIKNLNDYNQKINERLIIIGHKDLNNSELNLINNQIRNGTDIFLLLAPNFNNPMPLWKSLLRGVGMSTLITLPLIWVIM